MSDLISIKGGKDGLRMQLDETSAWADIVTALRTQLDQGGSFFAGAKLVLDVGERQLAEAQLTEVLELMQQHGVQPEALAASTRESRNAARSAGLVARPAAPRTSPAAPASADSEALLIVRTVRSGQIVRHQGHITLIGDVNPGAEIIAGGSVIVWGRLKGVVHAGALGDRSALVCAIELRPTQLRIADMISRPPAGASSRSPEIARVADGTIVVEPWEGHKRG